MTVRGEVHHGVVESDRQTGEALAALPPRALEALQRQLDLAGEPQIGAEVVNTSAELEKLPIAAERIDELAARASAEGSHAPVVRLGSDDRFALLVSSRHLWDLVDRIDELQWALDSLARLLIEDQVTADAVCARRGPASD